MPAQPSETADTPSRWGFISRVRKPFTQKARHISEFYIQQDDPHRQYQPGEVVTGEVVLKITKPVDITHIVVNLHGFAQVYKTPNTPGVGYKEYNAALVTGKTNKAGGYYGNGFASLFEDEIVLCGDGRLGEGLYRFGFELHFPRDHAPSSIDFERGTVTYMITSTVTRPSRASIINPITTCERRISFLDDIDISNLVKPKPRIVTLEPIIRRSRTRSKRRKPEGIPEDIETESRFTMQAQALLQTSQAHQLSSHLQSQGQAQGRAPSSLQYPLQLPIATSEPVLQLSHVSQGSGPPTQSTSQINSVNYDGIHIDTFDPSRSPGPSEESFDTTPSSGGAPSATESVSCAQSARTGDSRTPTSRAPLRAASRKPITTSVEISSAGFLRGDMIEIKVRISHTKHIKSLHGVIATLYRQARVDMHPALPLINEKDDELYPKSRTGLGGLSLSSAGSCHLYRKDFDQSFASIIINPETLAAEIKTSLLVPEDAFPTISTVPGAMISFKYYVEVILDIQGKLTALDKFLPTPNISNVSSSLRHAQGMGTSGGAHANMYTGWGGHFIDTEDIRREKSVVSCNFEIVIGSRDSKRVGRWKDSSSPAVQTEASLHVSSAPALASLGTSSHDQTRSDWTPSESTLALNPSGAAQENIEPSISRHLQVPTRSFTLPVAHSHPDSGPAPEYDSPVFSTLQFAIPGEAHEQEVDEKERMRRAEQRLLPSCPPAVHDEGSAKASSSHLPSAPSAPDLVPLTTRHLAGPPFTRSLHNLRPFASDCRDDRVPLATIHGEFPQSTDTQAPAYDLRQSSQSFLSFSPATDDKQEMERRRLEAGKSAPSMSAVSGSLAGTNSESSAGPSASRTAIIQVVESMTSEHAPSAPALSDADVFGFNERTHHAELPKYER